jgi:ParB/RepB/Spo0J family partition protein
MKTTGKKTAKADVKEQGLIWTVSPSTIIVDEKENPRKDYGDIEELMNSIVENGIKQPLSVYGKGDKVVLKNGFRRMRAIKLALSQGKKIDGVPVIIEKETLNEQERTLEHLIFNDGKPLTMLEQSEVIRRLLNFNWKVTEIVKKTGKARGYIDNLIMLVKAPEKIQNHIKNGKISAHAVVQIMQAVKSDPEKAIKEVEEAIRAAKESGKEMATPKHVGTKQVKSAAHGKFYKWADEIADKLTLRKDIDKSKQEVLEKLLVYFENGRPTSEIIELYFVDKAKAKSQPEKKAPVAKKIAPMKKTPAVKTSKQKPAKKAPFKKRK